MPRWLLFPVGLALARASVDRGELWWLSVSSALLVDVVTLQVLLRLAARFPLGRDRPPKHLVPFVATAAVFVGANIALHEAIIARDRLAPAVEESLLHSVLGELFIFLVWSGVAHFIVYMRRYRAEEADALRLRLDLANAARRRAEAELRSFENELNPRFLIGALRSAAQESESDPARSERLLVEIGDAVRAARPVSRETTLGDEIDALAPFVNLERERLNQEIVLASNVPDELLDEAIPHLVLSALVREALRGTAGTGPIAVEIAAARAEGARGEQLVVDVSCSQRDPSASKPVGDDEVLARTIEHLRAAYAGEGSVDVSRTEGGVRVRLAIPLEGATPAETRNPFPSPPAGVPPTSRAPVIWLALWFVALAGLNMNTTLTRVRSNGLVIPPHLAIPEALLAAAGFTLSLYVAIRLTRRAFGPRVVALHMAAAIGMGLVNSVGKYAFVTLIGHPYPPQTLPGVLGRTVTGMTMYAILAGILGAFEYGRRYRTAEEKSLRLRADLAAAERTRVETELRALKAELNPHFLGNALASASALLQSDPAKAREMLTRLADVVGSVVARVGTQEVTLQEEIDGLAPFIAVEQSRFGDRLAVSWEVDDDARVARVPHLILQPLVENAVKHGLAQRGGRIVVGGRRAGEHLELTVQDDGVGIEAAKRVRHVRRTGIGLANSRARLEQLYGSDATLQLEPAPRTGTIVRVTLPWR